MLDFLLVAGQYFSPLRDTTLNRAVPRHLPLNDKLLNISIYTSINNAIFVGQISKIINATQK